MNQFQPTILSNTGIIRNSCQIILVSMETQSMKKMMIFAYFIKGVRILISGSNFALLDLILSPSTDLLWYYHTEKYCHGSQLRYIERSLSQELLLAHHTYRD